MMEGMKIKNAESVNFRYLTGISIGCVASVLLRRYSVFVVKLPQNYTKPSYLRGNIKAK